MEKAKLQYTNMAHTTMGYYLSRYSSVEKLRNMEG